jgi:hypothetical protein
MTSDRTRRGLPSPEVSRRHGAHVPRQRPLRVREEIAKSDARVSEYNFGVDVLRMHLLDEQAAAATGWEHVDRSALVLPHGDDLGDSIFASRHHRGYGTRFSAETGPRGGIDADAVIDVAAICEERRSDVAEQTVVFPMREYNFGSALDEFPVGHCSSSYSTPPLGWSSVHTPGGLLHPLSTFTSQQDKSTVRAPRSPSKFSGACARRRTPSRPALVHRASSQIRRSWLPASQTTTSVEIAGSIICRVDAFKSPLSNDIGLHDQGRRPALNDCKTA